MRLLAALMLVASFAVPASAFEIKLDDAWLPKLASLCDAARYSARMVAEPICNDLAVLVQKAQADAKAKEPADKPAEK